jgi:flagellar basal-body rod modification protein FlgD
LGPHEFIWDGKDSSGAPVPPGTYKLIVAASAADGSSMTGSVVSHGTISEVDLSGSEPSLMIGSLAIPLSKATLISDH